MPPRLAYSAFMLLAGGVFLLTRQLMPKPPAVAALPRWQRFALAWAVLIGAAAGAKLGYVVASGSGWFNDTVWLTDGKTVTTALVGAYVAVELMKVACHIKVKTGDTYALPLALAMAVGRWGCFFNGCCYGVPGDVPWAVDFGDGIRRHPIQAYESLFHLTMAGVLGWIIWKDWLRNLRLKFYLIVYAAFRFVTEWLRPEPVWALGLTFYQWVCLGMIVGLSVQWVADRSQKLGAGGLIAWTGFLRKERPVVTVDLQEDAITVRSMIEVAVQKYSDECQRVNPSKGFLPVTRIDLTFSLGDSRSIPWVHLNFDTTPGSEPNGKPTHPAFGQCHFESWLPAVQAVCEGENVELVKLDDARQKCDAVVLGQQIGLFLLSLLKETQAAGVFAQLPKAHRCEFGVEDPTTGEFGWPNYEDRGKENLI